MHEENRKDLGNIPFGVTGYQTFGPLNDFAWWLYLSKPRATEERQYQNLHDDKAWGVPHNQIFSFLS